MRLVLYCSLLFMTLSCKGQSTQRDIPIHIVERSKFVRKVPADGNLKAVESTPIVTPQDARSGLKIAWLAEDGSTVKKGDVVIRFDPTDMTKELDDSLGNQKRTLAQINKEELEASKSRSNSLRKSRLAEEELERNKTTAKHDSEIFSRNQIIESKIDQDLASARLIHAQRVKGIEHRVAKSKVDLLKIQEKEASTKVQEATETLKKLEVIAPNDGLFTLKRGWRGNVIGIGDQVWPGQKIAELPIVATMEAEVFVLEVDAAGLEVDRYAEITIDAHPEHPFKGKIKQVSALAEARSKDVPIQYFAVTLSLDESDETRMKTGQRVHAMLSLDDIEALVVPRQAVFEDKEKNIVYKWTDNKYVATDVDIGVSSPGRVVIEKGLDAGDRIALIDPTSDHIDKKASTENAAAESK